MFLQVLSEWRLSMDSSGVIYIKPEGDTKWIMRVIIIVMVIIKEILDHWAQDKAVVCKGIP